MTEQDADQTELLHRPTRRIVFSGLGALGVAVALAGCGSSSSSSSSGGSGSGSGSGSGDSSSSASAGKELAKTSDVPVKGGIILTDQKIVITQPTQGQFKAFTAVCTHQGFTVTSVKDDIINCNHHGSEYSAADGSVKRGPAPKALASIAITVNGDSIVAA